MEEMLTIKQVQLLLKISRAQAYRLCRDPGFPVCHVGGKILVPTDRLRRWIADGGTKQEMQISPERRS